MSSRPRRHRRASAGQARSSLTRSRLVHRSAKREGGRSHHLHRRPVVGLPSRTCERSERSAKAWLAQPNLRAQRALSEGLACPAEPASAASAQRRLGLPSRSSRGERRLVARGGFEPPKPLGRQIYSLLRLTASLPRQSPTPNDAPPFGSPVQLSVQGAQPNPPSAWNVLGSCDVREWGAARILELAKGFEPPTG